MAERLPEQPNRTGDTVLTPSVLREWPLPDPYGDKYDKGGMLIIGGGAHTPGAVLLAAEAGLRMGAGKVRVATVRSTAPLLATVVPEAFVAGLPETGDGHIAPRAAEQILELAGSADAVLLGPGIMTPEAANVLFGRVVPQLDTAVLIDGLGMAYLTENLDGVRHLAGRALLTPNAGELATTLGRKAEAQDEDEIRTLAAELSRKSMAVVLGGAATSFVARPDGAVWRNEAGAPGMAAAGSGDVKAGAIAGLIARGAAPEQAAAWGAFLHGRAGERLTAAVGRVGFLARELVSELPAALAEIEV